MKTIWGEAKTVRELLSGSKYATDYYQREYKWGTKQVVELLADLTEKFLDNFDESHGRRALEGYSHYFLGSIIISRKKAQSFIVDGQQRLTTLTLLLIHLHNLQREEDAVSVEGLIFTEKFGQKSFSVDVDFEERTLCMEALFNQESNRETFAETGQPESVRNIVARYDDIEEHFSKELTEKALPYFVDWLTENVHMVEITAGNDEDAYAIFETMNDRGLSLSPTDMLKGYLLANITDEGRKMAASNVWKEHLTELVEFGKEEDADFLKAWLRSQYARKIRERKKRASPEDFERIGTEFHRWIRENRGVIGLESNADFARFVQRDLAFYARQYRRLRKAALNFMPTLSEVYYNAQLGLTLQYPVLLAPLSPDDSESEIDRKLRVVGTYIDILLARRLWNSRDISYNTMRPERKDVRFGSAGHGYRGERPLRLDRAEGRAGGGVGPERGPRDGEVSLALHP